MVSLKDKVEKVVYNKYFGKVDTEKAIDVDYYTKQLPHTTQSTSTIRLLYVDVDYYNILCNPILCCFSLFCFFIFF